jgi:hypothetical protein
VGDSVKLTHFKRQLNALLPGAKSRHIRAAMKKDVTDAFRNGFGYEAAIGDVDMFHGKYLGPKGSPLRAHAIRLLHYALWADVQVDRAALKADLDAWRAKNAPGDV